MAFSLRFCCFLLLTCSFLISTCVSNTTSAKLIYDNLDIEAETCPPVAAAGTETIFLDPECSSRNINTKKIDAETDCFKDADCQSYSKCCPIDHCRKRCIDLRNGYYTPLRSSPPINTQKLSTLLKPSKIRQARQVGCVACSTCLRRCETDQDCARGRRNQCYHNSCSSYCV